MPMTRWKSRVKATPAIALIGYLVGSSMWSAGTTASMTRVAAGPMSAIVRAMSGMIVPKKPSVAKRRSSGRYSSGWTVKRLAHE